MKFEITARRDGISHRTFTVDAPDIDDAARDATEMVYHDEAVVQVRDETFHEADTVFEDADSHNRRVEPKRGHVTLIDDEADLEVKVGDLIVFDPTGRDLPHCFEVGIVIDIDEEAAEQLGTAKVWPTVRLNSADEKTGELFVVTRAKAVLA